MLEKERSIIKYRPDLRYVPEILTNVDSKIEYIPSPLVDRITQKTPSGVLGELISSKEDAEVILEGLKKCVANDVDVNSYLNDIANNPSKAKQIEKENASSPTGSTQLECIPLLLDIIEEYERLISLTTKLMYSDAVDLDKLDVLEKKDHMYIDDIVDKEINGILSNADKLNLETKVIEIESISKMSANSKKFLKDAISVLYSGLNRAYNGNIKDIVQAYGEAPIAVLEALKDTSKVEFKKTVMSCENDKVRLRRLNTGGMKQGMVATFQAIANLRDSQTNEICEWLSTIDTDYDQNPVTQVVEDALSSVEFIREEYERAKVEYFKQIKLDELVKNDIIATLKAKKIARQKLNLISDIISERRSNSFDVDSFIKSKGLMSSETLCTR